MRIMRMRKNSVFLFSSCIFILSLVVLYKTVTIKTIQGTDSISRLLFNYGQSSRGDKKLYVKVISSGENVNQRNAIRNTWKGFDGSWSLEFIIESPKDQKLESENKTYGDIKHVEIMKSGSGMFSAVSIFFETSGFGNWLLVTKDTTFVNIPQVMKTISDQKAPFIGGPLPFKTNHIFLISYDMSTCVLQQLSSSKAIESYDIISAQCGIQPHKLNIQNTGSGEKFTAEYHARINSNNAEMGAIYGSVYSRDKMFIDKVCDMSFCPFKPPKHINNNTGWYYTKTVTQNDHVAFDKGFAKALVDFIKEGSVVDIGAGVGQLGSLFQHETSKIKYLGFDGGNNIQDICGQHMPLRNDPNYVIQPICWIDAAIPFSLNRTFDFVLSIEVGEHLAKKDESTFIDNLIGLAKRHIILSWAIINQGGKNHINNQNNDYIISVMEKRNFTYNKLKSTEFRSSVSSLPWLRNTIMVFERK